MNIYIDNFHDNEFETKKKYNEIFDLELSNLQKLANEILTYNKSNKLLKFSSIGSRDVHKSNFYKNLCIFKLISFYLDNNNQIIIHTNKILFFLIFFKRIIKKDIIFKYKINILPNLKKIFIIQATKIFIKKNILFFLIKFNSKKLNINLKKNISFIEQPIVFNNNLITDNYFNLIENSEEFKNSYFIGNIVFWKINQIKSLKNFIHLNKKYFFKENLISYTNLCMSFIKFFIFLIKKIRYSNNISSVFKLIIFFEKFNINFFEPLIDAEINNYFTKTIEKKNIRVKHYLLWWENQSIQKSLIHYLYLNNKFKNVNGYLGYYPRDYDLKLFPNSYESENNLIPKYISFNSQLAYDNYNNKFRYTENNVLPAYRYQYLHKIINKCSKDSILVCLPIYTSQSEKLVSFSLNLISKFPNFKLYVSYHPSLNLSALSELKKLVNSPSVLGFRLNAFSEYITKVNFVLSGNSDTIFESISLNRYTFIHRNMTETSFSLPNYLPKTHYFYFEKDTDFLEKLNQIIKQPIKIDNSNLKLNYIFEPVR